jgi:hypothetical protein
MSAKFFYGPERLPWRRARQCLFINLPFSVCAETEGVIEREEAIAFFHVGCN